MKNTKRAFLAGLVFLLGVWGVAGCGTKTSPHLSAAPGQTSIIATLPWEGAELMPENPTVIIAFSNPLGTTGNGQASLVSLPSGMQIQGQTGIQSSYLFFTPSTSLDPLSYYRFTLTGPLYDDTGRQVFLPVQGLTFSFETEGGSAPLAGSAPYLVNIFPSLSGQVFTNAVFRLTFSQPILQSSLSYGNDILIADTTTGSLVPVKLIPIDNNIVLQPVSGLTAGHTCKLILTNALEGINFTPISLSYDGTGGGTQLALPFTPVSAGVEKPLTVYLDPAVLLDDSGNIINMNNADASGVPMNANIVNSKLIGPSVAYLTGYLQTYMGNAAEDPSYIPIIIPAGQRLYGSALDVNLGGVIPTGLSSGKLSVTLLDNVTLFMAGNPYQNINPQAPPTMYAIQDLNLTAHDPVTNAVLNQNLMGVQLTGTVTVDKSDGSLIINLVGITELNIMGIEKAPLTLFLRFRSVPEGWAAPFRDNTFVATGTIPYNGDSRIGTDGSFIINFSGPIDYDPGNFMNMFALSPSGSATGYQVVYRGSSVVVTPYNLLNPFSPLPLAPDTPYAITAYSGLASLMGTALNQDAVFTFTTDAAGYGATTAGTYVTPAIGTVFPGDGETLPLFTHPWISLDKFIDPSSVAYNVDVFVTDTTTGMQAPGGVVVTGKKIQFIPSRPLINGDQYTFAVSNAVADVDGNTLTQGTAIHFTAASTPWFPILSQELSPVADRNQDAFLDGSESPTPQNAILMGQVTTDVTLNILGIASINTTATVYPQNPSYLSGQLNAMVTGIGSDASGNPQMQFVVDGGAKQFGTSVSILAIVFGVPLLGTVSQTNVTGRLTLSLAPLTPAQAQGWPCGTQAACGYIAYDTSAQQLTAVTYMAANANASDPLVQQMMSPYQPTKVVLSGPAAFLPDGRLALTMSGTTVMTTDLISTNALAPGYIGTAYLPTTIYTRIVSTMPSAWN